MERGGRGHCRYSPVFSSSFYALVRVLIQGRKVLPQLLVCVRHVIARSYCGELLREVFECRSVELVLV